MHMKNIDVDDIKEKGRDTEWPGRALGQYHNHPEFISQSPLIPKTRRAKDLLLSRTLWFKVQTNVKNSLVLKTSGNQAPTFGSNSVTLS